MASASSISVVVPTLNRAASLERLLLALADNDRCGIELDVIIADNGSTDETPAILARFADSLRIRHVVEPARGRTLALNKALDLGKFGDVIAFLDDDMLPKPDWCKGVIALTNRWPHCDIFSGPTYVVWPHGECPEWAADQKMPSTVFAVASWGDEDLPMMSNRLPGGGHLWIRSRIATLGLRYPPNPFPGFVLGGADFTSMLISLGYKGVVGPDAVAGHCIQPKMTSLELHKQRAGDLGRSLALVRSTYPGVSWQARLLTERPWKFKMFALANLMRWSVRYAMAGLQVSRPRRNADRLAALVGIHSAKVNLMEPKTLCSRLDENLNRISRHKTAGAAAPAEQSQSV